MMKFYALGVFSLSVFLLCSTLIMAQPQGQEMGDVRIFVSNYLKERVRLSGTLDLYDEKINSVRHLRPMEEDPLVEEGEDAAFVEYVYRDIRRGDQVLVGIKLNREDGEWSVREVNILDVIKLVQEDQEVRKDFTDDEIQAVMREYIETQSRFTGSVMLFDQEVQRLRNLDLKDLSPEVRRMGKYYISRAIFEDIDGGEALGIDITVEDDRNGGLEVQSLRIRDRR